MRLRRCGHCFMGKSDSFFSWKNEERGLMHSVCKECHTAYRREHYLANRSKYIAKAKKWNGGQKLVLRDLILKHLMAHPCVDCGEGDPIVLDFDHKADKWKSVAEMLKNCYSISNIVAEIGKCEVRCANCHRRKTSKDFGYSKFLNTMGV